MRLSPQDLDRQINADLDSRGVLFSPGTALCSSTWGDSKLSGQLSPNQQTGTQRKVVHRRHGWKPTLDDMERG